MTAFLRQFSEESDVQNPGPIRRVVVIASTQRSGSSLLGHYLRDTGGFGVPLEYFNQRNLTIWRDRFTFSSVNQFLDQVEKIRTTRNGIFAIKSHYFQLRHVGSIRDLKLRYDDCRFVRIVRRDPLRQAISRTVAHQTGVWITGQEPRAEARYDFAAIAENLRLVMGQHEEWSIAFAGTGTPFLEVVHEDFVTDPPQGIQKIAKFCGIDPSSLNLPLAAPIQAQRSADNEAWADRFQSEFSEYDEAVLRGHAPPRTSMEDLGRWARGVLTQPRREKWYRSPNLAP